jgi:hypothetical protein
MADTAKKTKPDREQLERALRRALKAGPEALAQQVRFILALSQMEAAQPSTDSYLETPATVSDARLAALVHLAETLSNDQRQHLLNDVQRIGDDDIRVGLVVDLVPHLNGHDIRLNTLWRQIRGLNDPLVRSQTIFALVPIIEHFPPSPVEHTPLDDIIALARTNRNTEARIRSLVALAAQLPANDKINLLNAILDEVAEIGHDTLKATTITTLTGHYAPELEDRILSLVNEIETPEERARALAALIAVVDESHRGALNEQALTAIDAIRKEDDRAEALVTFAPNLEPVGDAQDFPALMQHALAVAVTLSRRHIRARALVALAPHLTLDLQGEALAAVHSLSNERERSMLLADLAPTLPPNMLVASLAVAHTMREQDARVHALTILAHHVPRQARSQTLLDALAAAANLPHHYERVTALLALADILPQQLMDQAFTNALETTRHIENENARARALSLLGHHLPENLIGRALESAYQINDLQQRLNALTGIIQQVEGRSKEQALHDMLNCARHMDIGYKQARALVSIAPYLPPDLVLEALGVADNLDEPYDQVTAYIALAQNLPPASRPEIIRDAWELIKHIEDGYDRSSALAAVMPFLPDELAGEAAREAEAVIQAVEDEYDQASAITILAPLLRSLPGTSQPGLDRYTAIRAGFLAALEIEQQSLRVQQMEAGCPLWLSLSREDRYQLWSEVAQQMIHLPLADVLLCLGTLTPVLESIGQEKSLKDIAHILGVR